MKSFYLSWQNIGSPRVLNRPAFELTPKFGRTTKGLIAKYKTECKLEVVKSFLAGDGGAKLLARRKSVPEKKSIPELDLSHLLSIA